VTTAFFAETFKLGEKKAVKGDARLVRKGSRVIDLFSQTVFNVGDSDQRSWRRTFRLVLVVHN
jgi:hypothetical protein